ncbi:ABC transporter ATP-binding protein [Gordonia terrae]|uniref:ABC transporter ATP-binding protein n=1 Tax=Gordonia terrae TaxID=2055 RepID=UPI003F6D41EF
MSSIELSGLTMQFGSTRALDAVDLDIAHGEFVVFLGPSGCGKSTLLRLIAGLLDPSAGAIRIDGRDVTGLPPRDRRLAMVFQSYALYPHLTVAKNIAFPLRARRMRRTDIADRVTRIADTVQLDELLERRPSDLSGGQRQRVALARAMVQEPGAYLMDEPLSNLDAQLRSATRTELIDLHRRIGSTFLYVTHDQVEAMSMATRIVLLNRGRVEQVGTPDELYDHPETSFVATFLGAPPMCLFDATTSARAGEIVLRADGLDIPLGLAAPPDHVDQVVTAGIRPEKLRFDSAGDIDALVHAVENHGSDEIVHLRVGTIPLQARIARPGRMQSGDRVRVGVPVGDIHLFDSTSGRRLRWSDAHSPLDNPLSLQGAPS